jgi:hypothetical protein
MSTGETGRGSSPASAKMRREAEKARRLAAGTYGEGDRRRLIEIADTLDREAAAIERALSSEQPRGGRPAWMGAPQFREFL